MFYRKHKFQKKILFALFALFLATMLKGSFFSVPVQDTEIMILWNNSITTSEARARLADLVPYADLSDHCDDLSVCLVSGERLDALLTFLNRSEEVRIAEVNSDTILFSVSDSEYFPTQWALNNTGSYVYYTSQIAVDRSSEEDVDLNLLEAYELLPSLDASRTVIVAVIDTGVDITHPALSGHIWTNEKEIPLNGIDDDNNGFVDDVYGWDFYHNDHTVCHYSVSEDNILSADEADNDTHGTHCAGIIAASGQLAGVASGIDIQILPLKIHGGANSSGTMANAIKAIKYAQNAGAKICNLSWGTTVYSELLETVMRESGMLFVVAAGNNSMNNNAVPTYPACFHLDNMISVAYVTPYGTLANDSNYGVSSVDLAAPGQDIYSTTVGGGYRYLSGSSMATPMVTGTAALLYACGDHLYPQNVKEILIDTLKPIDSLIGLIRNPGIPDAYAALSAAGLLVSDTIAPTLNPQTTYQSDEILVQLNPEDLGGSGVRIICYAAGKRSISYFKNGTAGYTASSWELSFSKSGTYTFYIADYAGNESILYYEVEDDVTPPEITYTYLRDVEESFTVTLQVTDTQSGVKKLRYLHGTHTLSDFSATGYEISVDNPVFQAPIEGTYSIFVQDNRGNRTVHVIRVTHVPATGIFLSTKELTVAPGDDFVLRTLALPLGTSDPLVITVSEDSKALLSLAEDGRVTALNTGDAVITVTAGSVTETCTVHIVKPAAPTDNEVKEPQNDSNSAEPIESQDN